MDPTVLTIYCCGTKFNRSNLDFSVAYNYATTAGDRVWINDGPGNAGIQVKRVEAIMKRAEMGNDIPEAAFKKKHTKDVVNQLSGTGTQDNIITTLQWIWLQYHRTDKPKFTTINLNGWSRGGVTCIMLAHAIEAAGFRELIPTLKVNIFVFDPVPGGLNDFAVKGDFMKNARAGTPDTLPACVNEYRAVLAEQVGGMQGQVFKCVSPIFLSGGNHRPRKVEFAMPTNHGGTANWHKDNPCGRIALSLCQDFMTRHRSPLAKTKVLRSSEILELYGEALIKTGVSKTKGFFKKHKVLEKVPVAKVRAPLVANAQRQHQFFINQHHLDVFAEHLPLVFTRISTQMPIDDAMVKMMNARYPKTHDAMHMMGYFG